MTSRDLLERLIAATPPPPEVTDPDVLIAMFTDMCAARQRILDEADPPLEDLPELRAELAAREGMWRYVLEAARDAVVAARANTTKLRAYAR